METLNLAIARCATCGHRAKIGEYMFWDDLHDEAICLVCSERESHPQTAPDRGAALRVSKTRNIHLYSAAVFLLSFAEYVEERPLWEMLNTLLNQMEMKEKERKS